MPTNGRRSEGLTCRDWNGQHKTARRRENHRSTFYNFRGQQLPVNSMNSSLRKFTVTDEDEYGLEESSVTSLNPESSDEGISNENSALTEGDQEVSQAEMHLDTATIRNSQKGRPRTSFLKLAEGQRFEEIEAILDRKDEYDLDGWLFLDKQQVAKKSRFRLFAKRRESSLQDLHMFRGETPLHMILHYHPTESVVDKLIKYLSTSKKSQTVPEDATDMLGRTPLHVGAAKGCSSAVMSRLVSGVSVVMPAVAKDSSGRFALHWACANPDGEDLVVTCGGLRKSLKKNNDNVSPADNMVQVIFLLLKAYPEASTIPDNQGETPLDLAIMHGAEPRIIQLVEDSYQSCKKARSFRANGRPKYKDLHKTAKENSATEGSSDEEIPAEVSEHDYDEVSSIGSAGVSLYARKKLKESGQPWSLQVERIEEAIEL